MDNLDGTFTRVQCNSEALQARVAWSGFERAARMRGGQNVVSYHGQIDAFAVYCPENGQIYFAPIMGPGMVSSEVSFLLTHSTHGTTKQAPQ
jgi:arylamine N-acetyltransferase